MRQRKRRTRAWARQQQRGSATERSWSSETGFSAEHVRQDSWGNTQSRCTAGSVNRSFRSGQLRVLKPLKSANFLTTTIWSGSGSLEKKHTPATTADTQRYPRRFSLRTLGSRWPTGFEDPRILRCQTHVRSCCTDSLKGGISRRTKIQFLGSSSQRFYMQR